MRKMILTATSTAYCVVKLIRPLKDKESGIQIYPGVDILLPAHKKSPELWR